MRVRALVVIAALPTAALLLPTTARAQRVTVPRCWSSDWRSADACNRSYDDEAARIARREAAEERARMRAIDNEDRAARARERRLDYETHARMVATEARARAEERAAQNAERNRERADRARERALERARDRQFERSFDRPVRYYRWP